MFHYRTPESVSRRRWCLAAALGVSLGASGHKAAQVLRVGPGERIASLREAVRVATAGDVIELQAGDYHDDVAVITVAQLTIRGLGSGAVFRSTGTVAEGKAILVVRGNVILENLEFRGARAGGNGAGIRFERGQLVVRHCRFFDNENGMLTAGELTMALSIDDCDFGQAPSHLGLLHHLLYVGAIGSLQVTNSRFGQGFRGHLLKSRARRSLIRGNRLIDSPAGEASYELEFPEGGDTVVAGNVIVQSSATQNPVIVSMGAEAAIRQPASLLMVHNTVVNGAAESGRFVRVWTDRLPNDTRVHLVNNLFVGPGQLDLPQAWDGGGNQRIGIAELRDATHGDYRLPRNSRLRGTAVAMPADLFPHAAASAPPSPGALEAAD